MHVCLARNIPLLGKFCMQHVDDDFENTLFNFNASNLKLIMFCAKRSIALSKNVKINLSQNCLTINDGDAKLKGGNVVAPVSKGCKKIYMVDTNYLSKILERKVHASLSLSENMPKLFVKHLV